MAQRADGSEFPVELSLSMWQEEGGANFGAILRDITERRANEEQLFRLAHHDPLTELPNRLVLCRRIEQLADGHEAAALLMIDLDGFKAVNDDHGHARVTAVLRQVAQRLLGCVRATDTVARLGGDEFAVLLTDVGDHGQAGEVAETIIRALSRPIDTRRRDGERRCQRRRRHIPGRRQLHGRAAVQRRPGALPGEERRSPLPPRLHARAAPGD